MVHKKLVAVLVLVAVGLIGLYFFSGEGEKNSKDNLIRVTSPEPEEVIVSPLMVRGEARGYWFFEASFPVKVLDANSNTIGVGIAQAQEEWMTEEFVPFKVSIEFAKPETKTGFLVLEKDNPSGLPENADELIIPIKFL